MQSEILYADDLARLLGKSQHSISSAISRDSPMLPPGRFKMGRRWAWRRRTVDDWLEGLEAGTQTTRARRAGRPRATPACPPARRG